MRDCIKSFVIFLPFVCLDVYVILQLFLLTKKKIGQSCCSRRFPWFQTKHKSFFLFLNLKTHKINLSRNVIFYENSFPYHSNHIQNNDLNSLSLPIPQHYAQTHEDIHIQTENSVDNTTDDVF